MEDIKILPVTNDVTWIGALDPNLRVFDVVMSTPYGTTYNSYFINAQKKTVVEATKERTWDAYLAKLKQVCDPSEIEYIIVNHTEPDHAGNIKNLLKVAPNAKVVATGNALRYLKDIIGDDFSHLKVGDGDTLDLGNKTLTFIGAANLHWPDTMYTYIQEDQVLFTCDSFGAHYCNAAMYDDMVGDFDDAYKYYFDVIMKPFSKFMLKAIEKIRPLNIQAICTGHGPILRSNWKKYVDLSEKYATEYLALKNKKRVLIAYVSAYNNTGLLAEKIIEGIKQVEGIHVDLVDVENFDFATMDLKMSKANALIIGSPTINQNTFPQIYNLFALSNPIRDHGKLAASFGSYGWGGDAEKIVEANLRSLKYHYFEGLFIKFTPQEKDFSKYIDFGKRFAEELIKSCH